MKCIQNFGRKNLKGRDYMGDLGLGLLFRPMPRQGDIIKVDFKAAVLDGLVCIPLLRDRVQCKLL